MRIPRPALRSSRVGFRCFSSHYGMGRGALANPAFDTRERLLIFAIEAADRDEWREFPPTGGGLWTEEDSITVKHEIRMSIVGAAEFNARGSGVTILTIGGLRTGNVYLEIFPGWAGAVITVTATIRDLEPAIEPAPFRGTKRDADQVMTWTIIGRAGPAPTAMHTLVGPINTWRPDSSIYTYEMLPDLLPAGHPDYQDQTVLESFSAVHARFNMGDLTELYKKNNPLLVTADQVAVDLFTGSNNGTFVIDAVDRIYDVHGGFAPIDGVFTQDALASGRVGYHLPQTYSCGGVAIGSYVISRRNTNGIIEVRKTGP